MFLDFYSITELGIKFKLTQDQVNEIRHTAAGLQAVGMVIGALVGIIITYVALAW